MPVKAKTSTHSSIVGILALAACTSIASSVAAMPDESACPLTYDAGGNDVAFGDFDGDLDIDMAVTNSGVSILLNAGDGTYGIDATYDVNPWASTIAVGDLDGDGHLDLAVATYLGDDVSILLGAGDGTFGPAVSHAMYNPTCVAIGDVDADGDLDLVVGWVEQWAPDYGGVNVWLGNGDGTFGPFSGYGGVGVHDVALGDMDGDLDLDIVAAEGWEDAGRITILEGAGDGTFSDNFWFNWVGSRYVVAIADVDGDLDLDVIDVEDGKTYLNTGDGEYLEWASYAEVGDARSVETGDFDDDGVLDLVAATSLGVSMMSGHGDGTFGDPTVYGAGVERGTVAVADLDGDLDLDLAVTNPLDWNVTVMLLGCASSCPADLDGSGAVDFADLLAVLAAWGNEGGPEDVDGSGFVDFGDLLIVLATWAACR